MTERGGFYVLILKILRYLIVTFHQALAATKDPYVFDFLELAGDVRP